MTLESSAAFAVTVFVFAATPGPAILACIARALGSGFRSALALAAGIVLGDVLFLLVAIYSLAAMASVLEGLFLMVRIAGGGYLVWLGWKMWTREPDLHGAERAPADSLSTSFRAGLLLTLGNPKVILFYLGFLPAFMELSDLGGADVAWVVFLLVAVLMTVNSTYALTAARARSWARNAASLRRLNRGAGSVLMATGAWVAVDP